MGAAEALGGSTHNRLKPTLGVLIELMVPDAQNRPTFLLEEGVAPRVSRTFRVLAAIELDDQPRLPARKVRKIWTDRQLSRKLRPQAREHAPKLPLLLRRTVPQGASTLRLVVGNTAAHCLNLTAARASRTHP